MSTFTHNNMASMLNLQGVMMYKVIPSQENVYLKIGQPRRPSRCPYCQSSKLHSHGKGKVRKIKHGILLSGEMLVLLWQSNRFKCASCLKSFSQKPPPSLVQVEKDIV